MVLRASTCSFTSLQSYVEPELLRGVPLHTCLSGWAKHWQQPENAMCRTDTSAYDLGQQIEEYDVFLSHDWATSRWLKLCSMLIIFNSHAAFGSSFLVSVVTGFLRSFQVIPDQMWTISSGCEVNNEGPSRATRPCQRHFVKMSVILGLMSLCWHFFCVTFHLIAWTETSSHQVFNRRLTASLFTMLLLCTLTPVICYVGIQLMDDLTQLPQQLKSFRIQESKCFCCTSNHVHPVTGRRMMCDRSLVFHTLKKWFGSRADADHEGSHLELFNQMIQEELSQAILQTVGSDTAPLKYCIYMVSAGNVPFIAQYIARSAAELRGESSMLNHAVAIARQFMSWATISLISICAVRVSMAFWKLGLRITRKHVNSNVLGSPAMVSVLLSPVIVFTLSILWLPFQVTYAFTSNHTSLPAIPFGMVILATFYLFIPNVNISNRRRGSSLRQKLSDRYQSRRTRRSFLSGMRSSTSDFSGHSGHRTQRSQSDIFSERSRTSKDIFSDHSVLESKDQQLDELVDPGKPFQKGSSERGSKDGKDLLFTHVNSEKSRASKEVFSRPSSLASIETIAAGSRMVGLESCGIDSFGLNEVDAGGAQMRLESCGMDMPGMIRMESCQESPHDPT